MRISINEYDYGFSIYVTPESLDDVIKLSRFALGSTKKIYSKSMYFNRTGSANLDIHLEKKRRFSSSI
jgi:hypothetical protein